MPTRQEMREEREEQKSRILDYVRENQRPLMGVVSNEIETALGIKYETALKLLKEMAGEGLLKLSTYAGDWAGWGYQFFTSDYTPDLPSPPRFLRNLNQKQRKLNDFDGKV